MKDDGYRPLQPGDNDKGYHHGHAIEKPLARGSLDDRGRATGSTHEALAGKVAPTSRPPAMPPDLSGPAVTSSATSKPSWPPGRGKMRP